MYQREDTAVQRRKADLIAAGMSPVLAAGQGASTSAPVKIEAPQMDTSFGSRAVDALQNRIQLLASKNNCYNKMKLLQKLALNALISKLKPVDLVLVTIWIV